MTRPHRRPSGFTLPEVLVSAVLLATVILGGLLASRTALVATETSAREGDVDVRAARATDRILGLIASAGQSTLMAVPPGGGQPPGPLVDGVVYNNLFFRQAADFDGTSVRYEPDPATAPPLIVARIPDPNDPDQGEVVVNVGGANRVLSRNVAALDFVKQGRSITVTIDFRIGHRGGTSDSVRTRTVVLRAP